MAISGKHFLGWVHKLHKQRMGRIRHFADLLWRSQVCLVIENSYLNFLPSADAGCLCIQCPKYLLSPLRVGIYLTGGGKHFLYDSLMVRALAQEVKVLDSRPSLP